MDGMGWARCGYRVHPVHPRNNRQNGARVRAYWGSLGGWPPETIFCSGFTTGQPGLRAHPNPVEHTLSFSGPVTGAVHEVQGRLMFSLTRTQQVNTTSLAPGMYQLRSAEREVVRSYEAMTRHFRTTPCRRGRLRRR